MTMDVCVCVVLRCHVICNLVEFSSEDIGEDARGGVYSCVGVKLYSGAGDMYVLCH